MFKPDICPYCSRYIELVKGNIIYPTRPDLADLLFYLCRMCDAYVGTHKGTRIPKGTLANAELREWRVRAHAAFDKFWKDEKMHRDRAYEWLARELEIPHYMAHIGYFDIDRCKRLVTSLVFKEG